MAVFIDIHAYFTYLGKQRRRKIPVRALDIDEGAGEDNMVPTSLIVRDLIKRHKEHLSQVSLTQLQRLINRMRIHMSASDVDKDMSEFSILKAHTPFCIAPQPLHPSVLTRVPSKDAMSSLYPTAKSGLPSLPVLPHPLSAVSSLSPLSKSPLVPSRTLLERLSNGPAEALMEAHNTMLIQTDGKAIDRPLDTKPVAPAHSTITKGKASYSL